jgi:trans-feruloyl-CoA hydratase/vanillin synthase
MIAQGPVMTEINDTATFTVENRIAWVKFNRPEKRNCMSPKLNQRMGEILDELEYRDDVGFWC